MADAGADTDRRLAAVAMSVARTGGMPCEDSCLAALHFQSPSARDRPGHCVIHPKQNAIFFWRNAKTFPLFRASPTCLRSGSALKAGCRIHARALQHPVFHRVTCQAGGELIPSLRLMFLRCVSTVRTEISSAAGNILV